MPLPLLRAAGPAPAPILGIDLGTTFSLAAYLGPDGPVMIRDENGDARVPSAIGFGANGKVTIGKEAREHAVADPEHTVYSIKRLIGKTLADLKDELRFVPYQIAEREEVGGRRVLHVRIGDREHTPEELSAMILREVAARASAALGRPVERAVVTVPAYFDESQRQATRDAGRIAGLDVVRIVNEPTAAALAYGLHHRREGIVAVYDLGGGTFDCSILQLQDGVFKVLSTNGDTHLGGDDFDVALMQEFEGELASFAGAVDASLRQSLRDECERLKIALSSADSAELVVPLPGTGRVFRKTYTRERFEALIAPMIQRTIDCCKAALRDADLRVEQIDEVALVGGSSRTPIARRKVAELFGRTPHSELNPDEVVAMGAAVQGGILAGRLREMLLLDITPLSLGIETIGGAVSKLISRNSTIPARATERFSTFVDGQTSVEIHVLQGERELAKDCRDLGRFRLAGLPPMPAGLPQIDVTFLLDANGMLQVTARENRSGKAATIDIRPSQGLAREEVERMIRESVERAKEDFSARRMIELRNKADSNLRLLHKATADAGGLLSAEQRAALDAAVAAVKTCANGGDPDRLQRALDQFEDASKPLVELQWNAVLSAELVNKRLEDV